MSTSIDRWLADHGLEALSATMHANDIELDVLPQLSDHDLAELGISLGNRKRLLKAIAATSTDHDLDQPRPGPLNERRQVTVLFADMVGFTTLSEQLDPEETHRLLTSYFEIVDRIVMSFGGSIDKHIGDAVMAVFGAPKSHGNDAERAVRAANAIHEGLSKFRPRLAAHIGVAGGEVLASRTGSQDHAEYTVTGPSVNLASRLQGVADAGETLISEVVYQAIATTAVCEARGEIQVKGLSDPVKVWCLKRIADKREVTDDQIFVGRKNELQQAYALLEGIRTNGQGGVLYIRGEAGIGKTRFADQIEKRALALGLTCHTGLVLDFGVVQGEDALTLIMRSLCSVSGRPNDDRLSMVVEGLVDQAAIAQSDKVHTFVVLGAPPPTELKPIFDAMDNEARTSGRLRVMASLLRHAAAFSPILLRVEDVHWADESTLQALAMLAGETSERPVILVMTSRVEGDRVDHSWRASVRDFSFSILDLGPLRKDDVLVLASQYLSGNDSFTQRCIARAAGNPLFLEHLLRGKESDAVPGSIQSIVQARLDQLGEVDGNALRAASVLGQRFSLSAVRAIVGSTAYACTRLVEQRLVRPEGEDYLFSHALIRDGVYQSIVADRRKELHQAAARWFANRDLGLHAWHLGMAGHSTAPLAYLNAAQAQAGAHRYDTVIELCTSGLALRPARETAFCLLALLGEAHIEANAAATSIETFEKALEIAEGSNERARALIGLTAGMRVVDRFGDAVDRINQALELATGDEDHLLLAKSYFLKGNLEWAKGNYGGCITNHQASLTHAKAAGSIELEVQALGGLGDANYLRGRMLTANQYFVQCVKGADESGLGRIYAANRPMLAWCAIYRGKLDETWEQALEAREVARAISHKRAEIIALNALVMIARERGDISSIFDYTESGQALTKELGSPRFQAMVLLCRSWAYLIEGSNDKARECLHAALDLAKDAMIFIGPWIMGGLALAAESPRERKLWIERGLEILQRGAVSHNYFFFHSDVINACLNDADWNGMELHADMLARYTADEPLPWSNFMVERARWAIRTKGKGSDQEMQSAGKRLLKQGREMGLKRSLDVFLDRPSSTPISSDGLLRASDDPRTVRN
jgi:class 3 adenylate cyclase/tetratricopeptide (TPR) repeat protein